MQVQEPVKFKKMDNPRVQVDFPGGASLRGKTARMKEDLRPVFQFLGVPYAQPPVGEGRFRAPRPLQLWEGERDAKEFGPMCPQDLKMYVSQFPIPTPLPTNVSEDCLYVNVYTPTLDTEAKLPVMVWIHGGAFMIGSAEMYSGIPLCSHHDVVMVTLNYRVGALGFLSIGDKEAPGNYGLLDQIEALRWVQKYIRGFGGDPDNVTIYGESAGAISVAILVMSDLTCGLFKRAISQSGASNIPSNVQARKKAGDVVRWQLKKAGFTSDNSKDIVNYLQSLAVEDLLKTVLYRFRPTIDGHVVKAAMKQRYQRDCINKVDYLIGCNSHEYVMFVPNQLNDVEVKDRATACQVITRSMHTMEVVQDQSKAEQFCKLAMDVYFSGVEDGDEDGLMERLVDLYSDSIFVMPALEMAEHHSRVCPTYFYHFTHRPSFSKLPKWGKANHADDIMYMMGVPHANTQIPFTEEERNLSKMMMQYWVNFASTGDPNGPGLPDWPKYTLPQRQHLTLEAKPTVEAKLRCDKEKFWREDVVHLLMPDPESD